MTSTQEGKEFIEHVVFKPEQREKLAEEGEAMPDGSYPIRNRADLQRAIQAFGRSKNKAATKRWIIKRARALDAVDLLPDSWKESMEQSALGKDFLDHYGTKGMKWGVRKRRNESARAKSFKGKSKSKSAKDMSDEELRKVLNRMDMERRYNALTGSRNTVVAAGAAFVGGVATNIARTQLQNAGNAQVARLLARGR